jgi:NAD(P)-dependent dehydrogenase (short-subunit alcohol dehydrogenase family)
MDPRPDPRRNQLQGLRSLIGRKALITGGDSGMGRAAAIAYAREGADVVISYYPTEEPDARGVIQLIKAEGRKSLPRSGRPPGGSPLRRPRHEGHSCAWGS